MQDEELLRKPSQGKLTSLLTDWVHGWQATALLLHAIGICPMATPSVWYSPHGSLNTEPMLRARGIDPHNPSITNTAAAAARIAAHTALFTAAKLHHGMPFAGAAARSAIPQPIGSPRTQVLKLLLCRSSMSGRNPRIRSPYFLSPTHV
ncbi:uncharacterized protein CTHT_0018680 [Thermochaetoides thermophila DSM 1495]|uniref:Uncharacterized protein n=1 Tax=Chaetomium thermophilum (strain DSM 1495 / CBS 144.50 / IMI 039719) TaxID=759272 RepID=G0S2W1_CHATD|nr:hypothetical protein CTHT_0018680 [Thermochaetoides thermophila DSM 1495]EGS22344.1 hypothetical protein CTHT_0018680 [Thermochaetoides thermophila DSM 1495]